MSTDKYNVDPEAWQKEFFGDDSAEPPKTDKGNGGNTQPNAGWGEPDETVLRLRRRDPPPLPLETFGPAWAQWIVDAAKAACCPADYVAAPLLASASVLIGNARWPQGSRGWKEPPHLWVSVVGDSGSSKSPGADCLLRDVLPTIEGRMIGDFPARKHDWESAKEADKAAKQQWKEDCKKAKKDGKPPPPLPKPIAAEHAPEKPRLRQHDTTVEQVGTLLARTAPKGLLIVRDELAGWLLGMNAYNPAGRAFWLEAFGGRPYRVERRSHSDDPIEIEHLVVSVFGTVQPERLSALTEEADDGLFSRILWSWPEAMPFHIGEETPNAAWVIENLDKLRELDLAPGPPPRPVYMPLTNEARRAMQEFGRAMQEAQAESGGLLRSAYGKARGAALRLSCVLEWLWWCAKPGMVMPPDAIPEEAFLAAAALVGDYFMPMAERVYGDAGATEAERNAATLARWIKKTLPEEVHVRALIRNVRLPGLRSAEKIKIAAKVLVDADWLREPVVGFGPQRKVAYTVNPKVRKTP
jgi:hypothetical protein